VAFLEAFVSPFVALHLYFDCLVGLGLELRNMEGYRFAVYVVGGVVLFYLTLVLTVQRLLRRLKSSVTPSLAQLLTCRLRNERIGCLEEVVTRRWLGFSISQISVRATINHYRSIANRLLVQSSFSILQIFVSFTTPRQTIRKTGRTERRFSYTPGSCHMRSHDLLQLAVDYTRTLHRQASKPSPFHFTYWPTPLISSQTLIIVLPV
jgi:hypothetical protein